MRRMKKKPIDKCTFFIYKFFPLFFWKECSFCKQEFRREWGCKILNNPDIHGRFDRTFICENCSENNREVRNALESKYSKKSK